MNEDDIRNRMREDEENMQTFLNKIREEIVREMLKPENIAAMREAKRKWESGKVEGTPEENRGNYCPNCLGTGWIGDSYGQTCRKCGYRLGLYEKYVYDDELGTVPITYCNHYYVKNADDGREYCTFCFE
jgi:hypothetical protein